LASKMVIDGRHVRARASADVADGDPFEATVGEHPSGRPEQPLAGLQVASAHSVRRNSIVAAVIETTEKISRYPRSAPIASNPAMSDPTVISTKPESTALIVPERLKPAINSNFVIGVTR